MFYYIEGKIVFCEPGTAVIDVGGVAYKMTVSYNTFASMAGKDRARLYTYLSVSENGIELYGFHNTDELDVYKLLTSISGVGPKAALAILSIMTPAQLQRAVAAEDSRAISKALEALAALGYTKADASKIIGSMNVSSMSVEDIIREALKRMN